MSVSWSLPEDVDDKVACSLGKHEFEPDGSPTYTDSNKIQKLKCKHCGYEKVETTKNQIDPNKNADIRVDSLGRLTGMTTGTLTGNVIGGTGGSSIAPSNKLLIPPEHQLSVVDKNVMTQMEQKIESQQVRIQHLEQELKLITILLENICQQKKSSNS